MDSRQTEELKAKAIVHMKALHLFSLRGIYNTSVGQHSVDIQRKKADVVGLCHEQFFIYMCHMIIIFFSIPYRLSDPGKDLQQVCRSFKGETVRAVTKGLVRIWVDLQEDSIHSCCHCSPGKGGHEFPLA